MLGLSSIFLFNFFLHVFCNSTKTSANSSASHFCFDHFYIVDFLSGLTSQVSLQTNPQADAWWVGLYLFLKKMFFGTPYGHSAKTSKTATTFIPSIQIFLESLCMIFKENMGMSCPSTCKHM